MATEEQKILLRFLNQVRAEAISDMHADDLPDFEIIISVPITPRILSALSTHCFELESSLYDFTDYHPVSI